MNRIYLKDFLEKVGYNTKIVIQKMDSDCNFIVLYKGVINNLVVENACNYEVEYFSNWIYDDYITIQVCEVKTTFNGKYEA